MKGERKRHGGLSRYSDRQEYHILTWTPKDLDIILNSLIQRKWDSTFYEKFNSNMTKGTLNES
jgi:hypothetical protein